jgi:ArsR family transcriptional regulator, arsenate/arsenite/antimonite-responsive transcriptional repressor
MQRTIEEMSELLKLAADKTRLTILSYLKEKELCVCELVDLIGSSQPGISQHLRKMLNAGLLKERKTGTWVYYRLDTESHPYIMQILDYVPSQKERLAQYQSTQANACCETDCE